MTEWDDEALVLRLGQFHEADLWLKLLCRKRGLYTIFAFGGARSKRRFCGCLDVFNSLQCRIKSSRDGAYLNLQEAVLLETPLNLRHDWRGMGIAANCLRFVEAIGVDEENAPDCYAILEDLRALLERGDNHPAVTAYFFRLRVASVLGFSPQLATCGRCGKKIGTAAVFMADQGQILCDSCAYTPFLQNDSRYCMRITAEPLHILRTVQTSLPSEWPRVSHGPQTGECIRLIDSFVQYHLGLVWDNGGFRQV